MSQNETPKNYTAPLREKRQNIIEAAKKKTRDLIVRPGITRRNFFTVAAGAGITAAGIYDGYSTYNRMEQKRAELDKQNPQPPDAVIEEARRDVNVFDSLQKFTDNKFQDTISQEKLTDVQTVNDMVRKNDKYKQDTSEVLQPEKKDYSLMA